MSRQSTLVAIALLTATVSGPIAAHAQATSYLNTNFGLVAGEAQFLTVNNPAPTPFDQFFYDLRGPIDHTTPALKANFAYDIRISGRGGVGPLDRGNARPDAAYGFVNWQDLDLVHVPGDGFGVTAWDGITGRRPALDVYTTTHTYDYYLAGHAAPLVFTFRDNPYSDNVDGYQVSIYELGAISVSTVPEPATFGMVGGALLLTAWVRRSKRTSRRSAARR